MLDHKLAENKIINQFLSKGYIKEQKLNVNVKLIIYQGIQQLKMDNIIGVLKICCPWFFNSGNLQEYHKRIGQNQHQQFMRETFESSGYVEKENAQYRAKNTILQLPSYSNNNEHINRAIVEAPSLNQASKRISQDILSELPTSNYKSYVDCIKSSHPYYNLIRQKLQYLPGIFNIQAEPQPKVSENQYNLKILIKQSEDEKTNIFVYSFVFPTTYQFYEEMQNNFDLQKTFDQNIDSYQCQQKLDESTKIIYLAYKKILIVSPRDFVYVRYTFKKYNEYWNIATSIPNSDNVEGKTRGEIILTATRAIQRDGKLQLTVYSQVDMKMPVKASAAKVRGITQIKKYLDKCYEHVLKEKSSII